MSRTPTPLHVNLLLHYYAIAEPYPHPSLAAAGYTLELVALDLIRPDGASHSGYKATPRGIAHIEGILNLPLPSYVSPVMLRP